MRVVAKRTLTEFWSQPDYADAEGALTSWYDEACKANWKTPQDIKNHYRNASICTNHRVVFNITGNKYRLVVEIQYRTGIVWVNFIGTHEQYNKIDIITI